MATKTFKTITELDAGLPDNTQGLIVAENIRNLLVSVVDGRGHLEATTNVTLPITDGVWTAVNPLLVGAVKSTTYWEIDGNNYFYPNQSNAVNTVVPAGHKRDGMFLGVLELEKTGGGADNYSVQYTLNGVGIGSPESVEFAEAGINTLTLIHPQLVDISLPTDLYGMQIQGVGTSDDLDLGYFSMQITDSILLDQP